MLGLDLRLICWELGSDKLLSLKAKELMDWLSSWSAVIALLLGLLSAASRLWPGSTLRAGPCRRGLPSAGAFREVKYGANQKSAGHWSAWNRVQL